MYLILILEFIQSHLKMGIYKFIYFNRLKYNSINIRVTSFKFYLYKKSKLIIEGKLSCRRNFFIMNKGRIIIGKNVFFNNDCSINCLEKILIGENSLFGENVKIYDHDHLFSKIDNINRQGFKVIPVSIGKNCWIGSNVIILKGTKIGDNCVIGAGTIVREEIKSDTIVYNKRNSIKNSINI